MNVATRPAILDIARIREDFPILRQKIRGKDLVFLDSAASAQKPRLGAIEGVHILGRAQDRGGVVSFALDRAHAHDVATLLDRSGIAVRAGHHCAEPLMHRFGLESTARASFAIYTTHDEIDYLADTLTRAREFFK